MRITLHTVLTVPTLCAHTVPAYDVKVTCYNRYNVCVR
jgi:hypothetical protein